MEPGELKPILTALVLPPAGPLLLAAFGMLVASRRRTLGASITVLGLVAAWLLSTNGFALVLARHLMPPVAAVQPQDLQGVQAIVILGGGVAPQAPEYGVAQPSDPSLQRIRYGAWLARRTAKPVGFAGGLGWGAADLQRESEAAVARRVLQEDYGIPVRWVDEHSRDTQENAQRMAQQLRRDQVRRIALVTDATHMPRAVAEFRRTGLEVVPAPTGFPVPRSRELLEWLPSSVGGNLCRSIVREWLGRLVARVR